ncbi:MAG: hypothetical protein WA294_22270 [Acidobacteriaceae bacterium]
MESIDPMLTGPRRSTFRRAAAVATLLPLLSSAACAQSSWVHLGARGRLVYRTTRRGDRIPDFSSCGYRGGGVALPDAPRQITLTPGHLGDDTPQIQAAIDKAGRLPVGANGIHGAVVLAPGTYSILGTLQMRRSGVVLRGSGRAGAQASLLELSGAPHLAINITGEFHQHELSAPTWLADRYVPAGAIVIHVADASGIRPGDTLEILKPVTPAWVHFMRMDHLMRYGKPETWVKNNNIRVLRRVASVNGNAVRLEVPLTDSFDARFYTEQAAAVTRVAIAGRIAEIGVEDLDIVAPPRTLRQGIDPEFNGIFFDNVVDAWVRSVTVENTVTAVRIQREAERLTVEDVDVPSQANVISMARDGVFLVVGTQILIDRSYATGHKLAYVQTEAQSEGPVVVLHCHFSGNGKVEPHQRWSTGFLVDSSDMGDGDLCLRNRGEMGSGHGWTTGWSVSWNNTAHSFLVQNPPAALNWSIGDIGNQRTASMPVFDASKQPTLPQGVVESSGTHVEPASLYLEQLRERLGPQAVAAIGYP